MRLRAFLVLTLAMSAAASACQSSDEVAVAADGSSSELPVAADTGPIVPDDDASSLTDAPSDPSDSNVGPTSDAALPIVDAGADSDASAQSDSGGSDGGGALDSGIADAAGDAADAGPCVSYVKAPTSTSAAAWAVYQLGANTSQSVPHYCPTAVEANSCKFSMINQGAVMQPDGTYRLYPVPGACRVVVPDKCLVCTDGKTTW